MYRVMIVDDEALERQGLHLILEKHFGEEIDISDASNGKKAIEIAYMIKPDIVFMDMKMPGIDGIEAIKAIQQISPATKFVVVSAYDSFNYAQKAISMNVFAYLLKPVKRKDIIGCMDRLLLTKKIEIEKMHGELELKQQVKEIKPYFEQEFIQSVVDHNINRIHSLGDMQVLDKNWHYSYCISVKFETVKGSLKSDLQENKMMVRRLKEKIKHYLKEEYQAISGSVSENSMVIIVPATENQFKSGDISNAINVAEYLLKSISDEPKGVVKIGLGNIVSKLEDLNDSYKGAVKALGDTNFDKEIRHIRDISKSVNETKSYPIEDEKQLCVMVQQGLKNESEIMFNNIYDWIDENVENIEDKRIKLLELTAVLDRSLPEKVKDFNWRRGSQGILDRKMTQSDILRLQLKLWSEISEVIDEINILRDTNMDSIINKAKDYILKNYVDEISLEEISQYVSVSPYYFSKLFKQQTGENFIDFLTYVRIEKAKEMLRVTDLSMKVIAKKVGYKDPNYFSRVFKKVTQMKPSDFRQK